MVFEAVSERAVMENQTLSKPSTAFIKGLYSPSLSSRASSTEKISSLPEILLLSTVTSSQSSQTSIPAIINQCKQEINLKAQLLSPHYKSLSTHYSKLLSKSSLSAKANHLRLTLLKFLRQDIQFQLPNKFKNAVSQSVLTKLIQFTQTGIQHFIKYWMTLLLELFKNWSALPHIDRTCYLECLSRLMSRKEWLINPLYIEIYQDLLVLTIKFIFNTLFNLKTLSLSISAFIGKVFAYGFIFLPDFSRLLLFALFVKNCSIYKVISFLQLHKKVEKDTTYPDHLNSLIGFQGDYQLSENTNLGLMKTNCIKPSQVFTTFHSERLNEYFDKEFEELEKHEELNINLKDTNWVKRWASFDSDIFKSFLKHYFDFSMFYQNPAAEDEIENFNDLLLSFISQQPGGILIYSHILAIFDSNFNMLNNFKICQFKESSNSTMKNEMAAFYASIKNTGSGKNYQTYLTKLSFLKILKVLRSIIYTSSKSNSLNHAENEAFFIKYFESILLLKAKSISPFNPESCEVMYDLFLQLCLHLTTSKSSFVLPGSFSLKSLDFLQVIDWEFWILGLTRMLSTENMISQAKALTSLFNLWDLIPVDYELDQNKYIIDSLDNSLGGDHWILDARYSLVYNLSVFLVSSRVWKTFFIHWQPLIRHLYMRLVVFKVIQREMNSNLNISVQNKLEETYKLFMESFKNSDYDDKLLKFELRPSMPIFSKKLIITYFKSDLTLPKQSLQNGHKPYVDILDVKPKISGSTSSLPGPMTNLSSSTLAMPPTNKKVYAYDIFDDAIYLSSGYSSYQSSGQEPSKSSSFPSLPKSLSRTSLKSLTTSLKHPKAASNSLESSAQRSPPMSRSSSSFALNKMPLIGNALNFFKKSSSIPTIQEPPITHIQPQTNLSATPTQSIIDQFFQTPTLTNGSSTPRSSPGYRNSFHCYNGYSPSSSISEGSDEERSPHLLTSKKFDSSAHVNRVSSTASISSLNININATSLNNNSMDSIPPPLELMFKTPEMKSFKYKYQMVTYNDSFQQSLFLSGQNDTGKRFFKANEILKLDGMIPKKPRLPFDTESQTPGAFLRFFPLPGDSSDSSDSLHSEGDEGGLLDIKNSRPSKWMEISESLAPSPMEPKKPTYNNPLKDDSKLYEGIKSWQILGKVLNEWESVVDEVEKYAELVRYEMNNELNDAQDQWFWSPMLICDIPLSKSLYKE